MSTLKLKRIETIELRIDIAIPPERPVIQGYLKADAVIRNREEAKKLLDAVEAKDYADDVELMEKGNLYTSIKGLADEDGNDLHGDAAMHEVLHGRFSMYLTQALVKRYFEHFTDAAPKNSNRSRGR